jgi:hypothetical protein
MAKHKFGTAINCIDGRVQSPVTKWLKENYSLDFVDMITEPGPDRVVSEGNPDKLEALKRKAGISVNAHGSNVIVIAGHHDCAGNPVSQEEHVNQIRKSVQTVKSWNLPVRVIGAWVNDRWEVEVIES